MNDQKPVRPNKGGGLWIVATVALVLAGGGIFTWWVAARTDRQMRAALLLQGRLAGNAVDVDRVKALAGAESDLENPGYRRLREQLSRIRRTNGKCRFLYLMGRKANGSVFFYADSEPTGSKDYSPPGQVYEEVSEGYRRVFDTKAGAVEGPVTDRWGMWVSALVPLTDPAKGELIAVLGMDVDARAWKWDVVAHAALPACLMLVLLILLALWTNAARSRAKFRESESRYSTTFSALNDGLWDWHVPSGRAFFSPLYYSLLGYEDQEFTSSYASWRSLVHPEDIGIVEEDLQRHIEKGEGFAIDLRMKMKSGAWRWISIRGKAVERDPEGKALRMVGTLSDISERKRVDEELMFRNILLSTQQEASIDGILVVDEKNMVISYNRQFVEMMDIPRELIEKGSDEPILRFVTERMVDPQQFQRRVQYLYEHKGETSREELALKDGRTFDRYSSPMIGPGDRYYGRVWYFRDISDRKRAEELIRRTNERLSGMVKRLEELSIQSGDLREMGGFLLSCSTIDEIHPVVMQSMKKLFPDSVGALFLLSASNTDLESVVKWGDFPRETEDNVFPPDACWGLTRGGLFMVDDIQGGIICRHLRHPPITPYACLPLMAKSEVLGLLNIRKPSATGAEDARRWLAGLKDISFELSELLSLSISNIRLREKLSLQSIRDPLTGLFNRRFMEESFQKEISRAARKQEPIGVIMIDIDHFKTFNDMHGHAAGDAVLVELAGFFKLRLRGADVMCRYGGEEFVLILPEASLENTGKRAGRLAEELKDVRVSHGGRLLGPITLSMGIAAYPLHGTNSEELLRVADAALYRAKQDGRDRIVLAG